MGNKKVVRKEEDISDEHFDLFLEILKTIDDAEEFKRIVLSKGIKDPSENLNHVS